MRQSDAILSLFFERPRHGVGDRTGRDLQVTRISGRRPGLPFGDQSVERRLTGRDQTRNGSAAFGHVERLPLFHAPQIDAEILAELSDTDTVGSGIHVAQCSTMRIEGLAAGASLTP